MGPDTNSSSRPLNRRYDAVIVGARAASESTAMLLANQGLDINSYQWLYGQKTGAGVIPTVDGQHMVFAAMPRDRFRDEIHANIEAGFHRVLDETNGSVAQAVRAATAAGPIRSWPGQVGQFRKAYGFADSPGRPCGRGLGRGAPNRTIR